MPSYYYVYAPRSGTNWGQATYCSNGSTHTNTSTLCGGSPMDISGPQGGAVTFYGSSLVKSIKTTQVSGVCASDPAPWNNGVNVNLYSGLNGTGTLIGCVGYGHLENRVANGTYNVNVKQVGTLPADCSCGCSSGIHVHMEGSGTQQAIACYNTVTGGTTWIYRWYV